MNRDLSSLLFTSASPQLGFRVPGVEMRGTSIEPPAGLLGVRHSFLVAQPQPPDPGSLLGQNNRASIQTLDFKGRPVKHSRVA